MKIFISASRSLKDEIQHEIFIIKKALKRSGAKYLFFLENEINFLNEKEMMESVFKSIDASDIIIAEASDKAVGIGIEIGYAKAKQKTIIYIRNIKSKISRTILGTSDYSFTYDNIRDLEEKIEQLLNKISYGKE